MPDIVGFQRVVYAWSVVGVITFVALLFVTAPCGRHARAGWGPPLNPRTSRIIMEFPAS